MTFCNSKNQVAHTGNFCTLFQCFCFFKTFLFISFVAMCTLLYLFVFLSGFGDRRLLAAVHGLSLQLLLFRSTALNMRASQLLWCIGSVASHIWNVLDQGLNPCPCTGGFLSALPGKAERLTNVVCHYSHNKIRVLCFKEKNRCKP